MIPNITIQLKREILKPKKTTLIRKVFISLILIKKSIIFILLVTHSETMKKMDNNL